MDTLTFGIELEFICVRPETLFEPGDTPAYEGCEDLGAGPAIWHALNQAGIKAVGWENDWETIPTHSQWRVEDDKLFLSEAEEALLPKSFSTDENQVPTATDCIEISSRKLRFFHDDWHSELLTVLKVLREVESRGCRFITNTSTGCHIHVGWDNGVFVPLTVAKNTFQLFTAFERLIDQLHAASRIRLPEDRTVRHNYYPLSFFHTYDADFDPSKGTKSSPLLNRLNNIEQAQSYEQLGSFFDIRRPEAGLGDEMVCGHNSTVNFDNLFPDPSMDRSPETLTGTIEFRQHAGTLDFLDITAWTTFCCSSVLYCASAPPEQMQQLLMRGADPAYTLEEVMADVNIDEDVRNHYRNRGESIIGVLPDSQRKGLGSHFHELAPALIEVNDHECEQRASGAAVQAAIDQKFNEGWYGM